MANETSDKLDSVVARAIATKARLQSELREVELFLSLYQKLSGEATTTDNSATTMDTGRTAATAVIADATDGTLPSKPGIRQKEFEPFLRKLILEHGSPMQPSEILNVMRSKGRNVGGTDEVNNLKAKLWRAKSTVTNIPGSGYWPIDTPCLKVSYDPRETNK